VGWRRVVPSSEIVVAVVVALSTLALLYWRSGKSSTVILLPYAQTRRAVEVDHLLAPIESDRGNKALALMLAAISWKGDPAAVEDILSLADEFLQYLEGDNSIMPRADPQIKGRIPR
jgi:hypothetical protein